MFYGASSFNQSLNSWDVSNVIYKEEMFDEDSEFDRDNALWYNFD